LKKAVFSFFHSLLICQKTALHLMISAKN